MTNLEPRLEARAVSTVGANCLVFGMVEDANDRLPPNRISIDLQLLCMNTKYTCIMEPNKRNDEKMMRTMKHLQLS